MLAQATQEVLDRRFGGSVNAAHLRLKIGREVLTRMAGGWPPSLEIAERFAREIHEDPNRWRELCGYEPIRDERPPIQVIREASRALTYDPDLEGVTLRAYTGDTEVLPEDREVMEQILRAMLAEKRRQQGRE